LRLQTHSALQLKAFFNQDEIWSKSDVLVGRRKTYMANKIYTHVTTNFYNILETKTVSLVPESIYTTSTGQQTTFTETNSTSWKRKLSSPPL